MKFKKFSRGRSRPKFRGRGKSRGRGRRSSGTFTVPRGGIRL
jgi:hypothetical protein